MKSLISVVVPVHNAELYLRKCIESILSQSYTHFELILVNDGSEDDSRKICEGYNNRLDFVKLINIKGGG